MFSCARGMAGLRGFCGVGSNFGLFARRPSQLWHPSLLNPCTIFSGKGREQRPVKKCCPFGRLQVLTIGVLLVLAGVNIRGVRWGGGLQLIITIVKVASLLLIMVLPFILWGQVDHSRGLPVAGVGMLGLMASPFGEGPLLVAAAVPKYPQFSIGGLGTAFLGVLWAYHGWMNVAPVAGEVSNPQRNIPLAFLAGVGIVIFLYLGANLAYWLVIPQPEMALLTNTSVVADFARRFGTAWDRVGIRGGDVLRFRRSEW